MIKQQIKGLSRLADYLESRQELAIEVFESCDEISKKFRVRHFAIMFPHENLELFYFTDTKSIFSIAFENIISHDFIESLYSILSNEVSTFFFHIQENQLYWNILSQWLKSCYDKSDFSKANQKPIYFMESSDAYKIYELVEGSVLFSEADIKIIQTINLEEILY